MNRYPNMMRGVTLWACLLAFATGLAGTAGVVVYAHFGGALLSRGDSGVSRLFVGEAERMGNAGDVEQALALYEKAFQAGFSFPPDKSRALTLKGLLLWRHGQVRDAADALSAAVAGSSPNFGGAQSLVEALLHLKRMDEALMVVRRWAEALGDDATPQARAEMLYCAGRVAQERGDATAARNSYEESAALVPGNPAEYQIGLLCAEAGNVAEARRHFERFLLNGASGNEAAKARERLRSLESVPPPPK